MKQEKNNTPKPIIKNDSPHFGRNGIHLIIGLGNSEEKYENTYHNVGSLAVAYFKKQGSDASLVVSPARMLEMEGYMNSSGSFVKKVLKSHKVSPQNLLIVHDDSDLMLGSYKLVFNKSSAGHKGVENIIEALGTKEFWRLRIGIREEGSKEKAVELVLKNMPSSHKKTLEEVFKKILFSYLSTTKKNLKQS